MSPERKPGKILSIEDDKDIQELIKIILEKTGIKAEDLLFLSSLKDAKAYLEKVETPPDIILLNLDFKETEPYEYGLSLLQELRTPNSRFRQTPVIVISGYSDENTKKACLNLGAQAFVAKPFRDLDELPRAISNLLDTNPTEQ